MIHYYRYHLANRLFSQVPTVIYLERVDASERLDFSSLPYHIDLSLLSQDTNIATYVQLVTASQSYIIQIHDQMQKTRQEAH